MMIGIALMVAAVLLGAAFGLSLSRTRTERTAVLSAFASLVVVILLFVFFVLFQQQRELAIPFVVGAFVVPTAIYFLVVRLVGGKDDANDNAPASQEDHATRSGNDPQTSSVRAATAGTTDETARRGSGEQVSIRERAADASPDKAVTGDVRASSQQRASTRERSSAETATRKPLVDKTAASSGGGVEPSEKTPPQQVPKVADAVVRGSSEAAQPVSETAPASHGGGADGEGTLARSATEVAERAATERIAAQRLEAARRAQAEREAAAAERAAGQRKEAQDKVSEQAEAQRMAALRQAQQARIAAERKMAAERAAADQGPSVPAKAEVTAVRTAEGATSNFDPERYFMRATLLRDRGLFVAAAKLYEECASLSDDDETFRRATVEQIACYVKGGMADQARELATALKASTTTLTMGERIKVDAVLKLAEQQ